MELAEYQGEFKGRGTGWKVHKDRKENHIQCSLIKSPTIYIEPIPRQKIEFLMEEYLNREWLGYLVGRESEKENYFVEDVVIPPHKEANVASAEAEPFHIPEGCIGIIHSHHTMGAFHSGTDQAYVDKNFPVSITVARKNLNLEYDAVSYQITPCDKGTAVKCPVKYVQLKPLFDKDVFLKEAKENIDKGRRTIPVVYKYAQKPSFVPSKYLGEGYATDDKGNVLTQKELDNIMREIYD